MTNSEISCSFFVDISHRTGMVDDFVRMQVQNPYPFPSENGLFPISSCSWT